MADRAAHRAEAVRALGEALEHLRAAKMSLVAVRDNAELAGLFATRNLAASRIVALDELRAGMAVLSRAGNLTSRRQR